MRKNRLWLAALLCAALLAGCGAPAAEAGRPEDAPEQAAAPGAEESAEQTEAAERDVENNGGHFVRVGDQVWFRVYGEGVIDEPQLWGAFLSAWPGHGGASSLYRCDLAEEKLLEALPDGGFGPLWYGTDGFYLTRIGENGGQTAYFRPADGGSVRDLREGEIAGLSENGRFEAVRAADGALHVYEGQELLGSAAPEKEQYLEYAALTDDGALLYCRHDCESGTHSLMQREPGGKSLTLGEVPADGPELSAPELKECMLSDGTAYFVFGWYEGTAHILARSVCLCAVCGEADSLRVMEREKRWDEAESGELPLPKLVRSPEGTVSLGAHAAGAVELAEDGTGDLLWYDGERRPVVLVRGFLRDRSYEEDGTLLLCAETLGGAAWLIAAEAYRAPEDDIGWRYAFRPGAFHYLRVPLRPESEVETLVGDPWSGAPPVTKLYADYIGEWTMVDSEVEGARGGPPPEGSENTLEFLPEGRVVMDRRSADGAGYHNEFTHMEALPDGRGGYGLLLTGEGTQDMLYAYFEEGLLVATVQQFFVTEYGQDAMSATGFYERVQ